MLEEKPKCACEEDAKDDLETIRKKDAEDSGSLGTGETVSARGFAQYVPGKAPVFKVKAGAPKASDE